MRARIVWLLLFGSACGLGCNAIWGNDRAEGILDGSVDAGTPDVFTGIASADGGAEPDAVEVTGDAGPDGCAGGSKLCNGECVSTNDPLHGCAAEDCTPCALDRARAVCAGGACAVGDCTPGFSDCNQSAGDGCETDLSQASHCGTCNAVCGAANPVCAPAGAGFGCTTGCTASAPTLCGSQCVDLQTAITHCGGCNNVCPAVSNGNSTCAQGHCGFTCNAGFHACGASCASNSEPATCGKSCSPCPPRPNAVATCDGTSCGIKCATGFANCDNDVANGCEASLANDARHCGTCGNACAAGASCVSGVCTVPDAGGPADAAPPPTTPP